MSLVWQQCLNDLSNFIVSHNDIAIGRECTIIPADIRPDFYRLFDSVRNSFIHEYFAADIADSSMISDTWKEAARELTQRLKLSRIVFNPELNWFLLDPTDGLMRGLFDPLFNLLKGITDIAAFEQIGRETVSTMLARFTREGYQRSVTLALINAMLPDELYKVTTHEQEVEYHPWLEEADVPDAMPTDELIFDQHTLYPLLTPKILVHSSKTNGFLAFRPGPFEVRRKASAIKSKQDWLDMKLIEKTFGKNNLWPDLLIYKAQSKEELLLLADSYQIAQPDITIDFKPARDWYEKEGLASINRHFAVLPPKTTHFIICRHPIPEVALGELAAYSLGESKAGAAKSAPGMRLIHVDAAEKLNSLIASIV